MILAFVAAQKVNYFINPLIFGSRLC